MIKIHVHPQKNANSYTESYAKNMLFHPPNKNTPFTYHESFSLKSFHVPKGNMGHVKKYISMPKRAWEKICMPKGMRKNNNPMLRSMKKSKRKKDSPYFQIKGNHQKRESHAQRSLEF